VLQVSEIALAVVLADLSIHVAHGGPLVAGALLLFVLAGTADGPLGVVRIVGRDLHVQLAVVVAVVFAVLVWLPALHADSEEKVVVMFTSIGLIRLATLTSTTGIAGRGRRARSPRPTGVIETTATVTSGPGATAPDARDPGADSALRKAGRTTGAAAAAGRRAVDGHRPQVEDGVRRTIRGAGRWAGKLAGPKEPTEAPTEEPTEAPTEAPPDADRT